MAIGFMSFGGMLTGGDDEKKEKNIEATLSNNLAKEPKTKITNTSNKSENEEIAVNIKEIQN